MATRPQLAGPQTGANQSEQPRKARTIDDMLNNPETLKKLQHLLGSFMTPERFVRLAMQALNKTPRLRECDPMTVLGAFMAAASLKLEPNTPTGQAYLIPYKTRRKDPETNGWYDAYECQFQIGYRGFVTMAYRSEHVAEVTAEAVREGDYFDHQKGTETFLKHRKALSGRGQLLGSYCYVRLKDGQAFCVLPIEEIHKIRGKSETYRSLCYGVENASDDKAKKKALEKLEQTPWVLWEDDMAAKSALKKLMKQLPISPEMDRAATIDSLADTGDLNLAGMVVDHDMDGVIEDPPADAREEREREALPPPTEKPMETVTTTAKQAEPVAASASQQQPQERKRTTSPPPPAAAAQPDRMQDPPPNHDRRNGSGTAPSQRQADFGGFE